MNKNLENAINDIDKVDALMHAIEGAFLDIECVPDERKKLDRGTSAFYALWDAIGKVADDLEKLEGDMLVVKAICNANSLNVENVL